MATREQLKRDGLHAYEVGRLGAAARAAWVLVPAALVCALETGAGETCLCIGVVLLSTAIFLRWRDRRGSESVRDGLLAGALPLVTGLVVARVVPSCDTASLFSLCTAGCLGIGILSGMWLGARLAKDKATTSACLAAGCVAVLAASLGFAGLGVAGLFGTAAGLCVGTASARALLHVST